MSLRPRAAATAPQSDMSAMTSRLKAVLEIGMMRSHDEMMKSSNDAADPPPAKMAKPPVAARTKRLVKTMWFPVMKYLKFENWGLPGTAFDLTTEVLQEINSMYDKVGGTAFYSPKQFTEFVKGKLLLSEFESQLIDMHFVEFSRSTGKFYLTRPKLETAILRDAKKFEIAVASLYYFYLTVPNLVFADDVAYATHTLMEDSSSGNLTVNYRKDLKTYQSDLTAVKNLFERVADETPGFVVTKNIFETPRDHAMKVVVSLSDSRRLQEYFLKLKAPTDGDETMLKEKAKDYEMWLKFHMEAEDTFVKYPKDLLP